MARKKIKTDKNDKIQEINDNIQIQEPKKPKAKDLTEPKEVKELKAKPKAKDLTEPKEVKKLAKKIEINEIVKASNGLIVDELELKSFKSKKEYKPDSVYILPLF